MEMKSYGHGVPSWVDVGCPDTVATAHVLPNALLAGDVQPGPPEAGWATQWPFAGGVAGLGPMPDPATPPFWLTYVNVDSADEIVDKVTANGGHVFVPPMDVLDFGRMAVFADPMGAILGAWQPGSRIGAELINEPNTLCWSELLTSDVEAAKAFYGAVFGWGAVTHSHPDDLPDAMAYTEWELGGVLIGGLMLEPPSLSSEEPSHWVVYFAVDDTERRSSKGHFVRRAGDRSTDRHGTRPLRRHRGPRRRIVLRHHAQTRTRGKLTSWPTSTRNPVTNYPSSRTTSGSSTAMQAMCRTRS